MGNDGVSHVDLHGGTFPTENSKCTETEMGMYPVCSRRPVMLEQRDRQKKQQDMS